MIFLLDTHMFLWFIEGDLRLSPTARELIEDAENTRLVSLATLWEIAIKSSIGKLELAIPVPELVARHIRDNAMDVHSITPEHLESVRNLPFYHRDPFDRMLVAQSRTDDIPILSHDPIFDSYGVRRFV